MPWTDAFAPAEAHYRAEVMATTWGHLAPRKRKTYQGYILFAIPTYDSGNPCIVDAEFKGLRASPWLFDAMVEFAEQTSAAGFYRFDGTLCDYEFNGEIRRLDTSVSSQSHIGVE